MISIVVYNDKYCGGKSHIWISKIINIFHYKINPMGWSCVNKIFNMCIFHNFNCLTLTVSAISTGSITLIFTLLKNFNQSNDALFR